MDAAGHELAEALDLRAGTLQTDEPLSASLCGRCVKSVVFKREGRGARTVFCCVIRAYVPSDIDACSDFTKRGELNMHELVQLAVLIDPREGPPGGYA